MAVGVPVGGACGQQCENGLSVGTWTRGRGAWTGGCGWPDSRKAAWRNVHGNRGLLGGGASEAHSSDPGGDNGDNGSSRHSGGCEAGGGQLEAVETTEAGEGLGRKRTGESQGETLRRLPGPRSGPRVPVSSAHPQAEEQMRRKIQFDPVEWSLKCPWDAQTKSFLRSELTDGREPGLLLRGQVFCRVIGVDDLPCHEPPCRASIPASLPGELQPGTVCTCASLHTYPHTAHVHSRMHSQTSLLSHPHTRTHTITHISASLCTHPYTFLTHSHTRTFTHTVFTLAEITTSFPSACH